MNLPPFIEYIILILSVANILMGIVTGIITILNSKNGEKHERRKLKFNDFKNTMIYILIGLLLFFLIILLRPKCEFAKVRIKSLSNNEYVSEKIDIVGKAKCISKDKKIALIVHWVKQDDVLERWFIHPECASLGSNNFWKFTGVEIGTKSMQGKNFEIFAYAINDSIFGIIQKITKDPTYHGTTYKPIEINGVFDKKTIRRRF